jgi:hypothetical protein
MMTCIRLWYLAEYLLKWDMFQPKVVEKIKPHFMLSNSPPPENPPVYEIMWLKYGRTRHVTDDTIIRCVRFVWWVNKATDPLRIRNIYSFSTVTIVKRTRLSLRYACVVNSEVMDACYVLTVLCSFCLCFAPCNVWRSWPSFLKTSTNDVRDMTLLQR